MSKSNITLRNYQSYAVKSVFDYYAKGETGNPLIALPTGTGKSLVLAAFIKQVLGAWSDQKILILTHVKELILNDVRALHSIWPDAPIGVYSASLNSRTIDSITFGGIATVANNMQLFEDTNIILVDEAHLVSTKSNTMYRKVFDHIKLHNPNVKVIGTTATIYRLGQGLLTEGPDALFTDVCCDLTGLDAFNWFLEEGYLAPLIPRPMKTEFDLSQVHTMAGEYNVKELATAVDRETITEGACEEIIRQGVDRKSWLVFATSIDHARHIGFYLRNKGITVGVVHSKIPDIERDSILAKFTNGEIQCVVNQNILTTGFDHPSLDLIAVMRPTKSASLWVQMLGRGTRPLAGKKDCLVLDFARNTERLGPINDPVLPKVKGKSKKGTAPVRICPECSTYNHASAKFCICCGFEFPRGVDLYIEAGTSVLIAPPTKTKQKVFIEADVTNVTYKLHPKGGFTSLRVTYFCGVSKFDEYIHFERSGYMRNKAVRWLKERLPESSRKTIPLLTDEVLDLYAQLLVPPKWIRVQTSNKYPEIVHYGFRERALEQLSQQA